MRTLRPSVAAACWCACLAAHADEARPFAAPAASPAGPAGGVGQLGEVTLALGVVLAAIFAVAWLVRRVRGTAGRAAAQLDVLAEVPLGVKERAVLLRVGSTQLLIGVAPGRVSTLHVLAEPIEIAAQSEEGAAATRPSFRALLARSLGRGA